MSWATRKLAAMNTAWWHAGLNVLAVLIELYNWYLRFTDGSTVILPTGLVLSAIVVALLFITGWLGGQMV